MSESDAALRDEIRAAIAAGRDLDPTMDEHLANSVLESTKTQRAATVARPVVRQSNGIDSLARLVITLAVVGGIFGLIVLGKVDWWLIFLIWPILGLIGINRWGHHGYSYQSNGSSVQEMRDHAKAAKYEARASYYRQRAAQYRGNRDPDMM